MAPSPTSIRSALARKVFVTPPASSLTLVTESVATSTGGYDSATITTSSTLSVLGVPYQYTLSQRTFNDWGSDDDGSTQVALPYDVTVTNGMLLYLPVSAEPYEILDIRAHPYGDLNMFNVVTVRQRVK